ncbi:MAG: pyridoxal-phosphate dependent enzyme [Bdellovibrionales bacterium]|nr:pyridoxal-phosphate dependent enzyme [Bdellovibrionales bacterium]
MKTNLILDEINNTPVVKLKSISKQTGRHVYVKLEGANPAGSMKDRVALYVINEAERKNQLRPGDTIVESTSGSMGAALAMVGKQKGYSIICVVDPKLTKTNEILIKSFGAKVVKVKESDENGNYLSTRINTVKKLINNHSNYWWFNQYQNPDVPLTHYNCTAKEIDETFEGGLDWIICPVGTGGLIAGIAKYFKEKKPNTKIMAVDALGSVVLGGKPAPRYQVGIGSNQKSSFINLKDIDAITHVSDNDAFEKVHFLAKEESLFCGCSTGSTLAGFINKIEITNFEDKVLIISPDNGFKYIDTIFDSKWIDEKLSNYKTQFAA